MSEFDWRRYGIAGSTATWHAVMNDGPFKVRVSAGPDPEGCDCEDCQDQECAPDCAHQVAVVSCEVWAAGVMLASDGVGQTGFDGGVPGDDVDEEAGKMVAATIAEARVTLRKLAPLAKALDDAGPGTAQEPGVAHDGTVSYACPSIFTAASTLTVVLNVPADVAQEAVDQVTLSTPRNTWVPVTADIDIRFTDEEGERGQFEIRAPQDS